MSTAWNSFALSRNHGVPGTLVILVNNVILATMEAVVKFLTRVVMYT
jgi:hypothetical protein